MPWHTVDGLFFVITAIFLFSHHKVHAALISGLIAAGCKQSFYFFHFMLLIILLDRRHRSAKSLCIDHADTFLTAAVFVSLFNFEAMLGTKGSGQSINTLIEVAVLPYLTMRWWHIATVLGALVAYRLFRSQGQLSVMIFFMIYIPLASMAVVVAQIHWTGDLVFSIPPPGTTQLAFTFVAALTLIAMIRNGLAVSLQEDRFQIAWLFLGGAWMSTISWGYNNHVFSFGLLLAAWALITSEKTAMSRPIMTSLIVFLCMAFVSMKLVTPYRTAGLLDGRNAMVASGVYKFIVADQLEHQRLATIEKMFHHEGCVEIYPSAPQAHMTQARPTKLPAGWMLKVEYPRHEQTTEILAQHDCKLFIERDDDTIGWSAKNQLAAEFMLDDVRLCLVAYNDYEWMVVLLMQNVRWLWLKLLKHKFRSDKIFDTSGIKPVFLQQKRIVSGLDISIINTVAKQSETCAVIFDDVIRNSAAKPANARMFLNNKNHVGYFNGLSDCLAVQRFYCMHVEKADVDAILFKIRAAFTHGRVVPAEMIVTLVPREARRPRRFRP